jgi:hypothetical protein
VDELFTRVGGTGSVFVEGSKAAGSRNQSDRFFASCLFSNRSGTEEKRQKKEKGRLKGRLHLIVPLLDPSHSFASPPHSLPGSQSLIDFRDRKVGVGEDQRLGPARARERDRSLVSIGQRRGGDEGKGVGDGSGDESGGSRRCETRRRRGWWSVSRTKGTEASLNVGLELGSMERLEEGRLEEFELGCSSEVAQRGETTIWVKGEAARIVSIEKGERERERSTT